MIATQAYEEFSASEKPTDDLVLEQLPQVKFIARRIHERLPQHVPLDDLVHAGIVGLIDAMHKYDANKNVRFASYAKFRIRGAILDSLREMDWSPRDLRRKARKIEQTIQQLQGEMGHAPSEPELAEAMGLSLEAFQHLLDEIRGLDVGSLQVESLEDGRETNLAEMIAGPADLDPLHIFLVRERRQLLAEAISQLPAREQQVLALYYQEELTMKETGEVLGVGESRVSQIHSLAVARLRAILTDMNRARTAAASASAGERCEGTWKRS
jgi:RNA polymerase sigma factor for flagellar operon FliA